jgi:hypothetical protein
MTSPKMRGVLRRLQPRSRMLAGDIGSVVGTGTSGGCTSRLPVN